MFVVLKYFETSQLGGFLCCVFAFCVAFKLGEMHFSYSLYMGTVATPGVVVYLLVLVMVKQF